MALKTSLAEHWKLGEASGDFAGSLGAVTLTNHSVGRTTGKVGGCGSFVAASSQYAATTSNNTVRTGDIDFTLGAWVQILAPQPTGAAFIFGKWGASGTREYALYYTGSLGTNRFSFIVSGTGTTNTAGTDYQSVDAGNLGAPSLSTWYLVLATHDSVNNLLSISVNAGTANTQAWSGGVHLDTNEFAVGRDPENSGYWSGLIDEGFLSKRIWTTAEATQIYNGGQGLGFDSWDAQVPVPELRPGPNDPRPAMRVLSRSRFVFTPYAAPVPPAPITSATAAPLAGLMPVAPIPGTPWFFSSLGRLGARGLIPPAAPVDNTDRIAKIRARPYLNRNPRESAERRLARFADNLSSLWNSLVRQGQLVQTDIGDYAVRPAAHVDTRDPTVSDDITKDFPVGCMWVNSVTRAKFFCVDNTEDAAVWS